MYVHNRLEGFGEMANLSSGRKEKHRHIIHPYVIWITINKTYCLDASITYRKYSNPFTYYLRKKKVLYCWDTTSRLQSHPATCTLSSNDSRVDSADLT